MTWATLLHLGDIELTLALAAAITAWLLTARAWRLAFWWSTLFALGIGLVTASKVAFMAWGVGLHSIDFKAASGHATGATAVFTILFYLLMQARGPRAQASATVAGLVLGCLMVALLVALDEHSVAESLAGWFIGAAVSLGAIRLGGGQPALRARPQSVLCGVLVFALAAWLMHGVPYGYMMFRTALYISGESSPSPVRVCTGG